MRTLFSYIYCGNLVKILEVNLTILWKSHNSPLEILTQKCLHFASSNWLIAIQVFLPRHWFPWQFLLVLLCSSKLGFPVLACLSNLTGIGFPFTLPFLTDPRTVVDFSVCLAFTCYYDGVATSKLFTYGTLFTYSSNAILCWNIVSVYKWAQIYT